MYFKGIGNLLILIFCFSTPSKKIVVRSAKFFSTRKLFSNQNHKKTKSKISGIYSISFRNIVTKVHKPL